ncbi:phosphopantetheine-binding protein [Microbulbifer sp. SA54]|uniref:phosphopantetheine-binding protein n=1 Tax=Microbulbifer sp. SA54 TaxID=3401577 RepID=UPI003AAAAB5B
MSNLVEELKVLIIDVLNLEDITPEDIQADEALFGDGLGLDSIDALELGLALQKTYNISIDAENENTKTHFASVNNLAKFVADSQAA